MHLIDTRSVQARLRDLGFDPGPVDGIRGRMTIAALKAFQTERGLTADGVVGAETFRALFDTPPGAPIESFDQLPWYQEALRNAGVEEVVGRGSNPQILGMAETLDIDFADDDIPWCGLFVGHCVAAAMPDEALPGNVLLARNWERFGIETTPQLGAIMVFWRKSPTSGSGHVGLYFAEDDDAYHILGGNQSNGVNVRRVSKQRFLTARWPITGLSPLGFTVAAAGTGSLSTNEA